MEPILGIAIKLDLNGDVKLLVCDFVHDLTDRSALVSQVIVRKQPGKERERS